MNQSPSYLIAQFVTDAMRLEPRNIGVFAWTPLGIASRFLGERNGILIPSQAPGFIRDPSIYGQWIDHWKSLSQREKLEPRGGGETVSRADDRFLETLATYSKQSYLLREGGVVLDAVNDVEDLAEYLFENLVKETKPRKKDVRGYCKDAVESTRLADLKAFQQNYEVRMKQERFHVDYSVVNGSLQYAVQGLSLSVHKKGELNKDSEEQVNNAKWVFGQLKEGYGLAKGELRSVILFPEDAEARKHAEDSLGLLYELSEIVDARNSSALLTTFKKAEELATQLELQNS